MRALIAIAAAAALLGCDSTEPSPIAGTWVATEWTVTEPGEPPVDVLAEGGGLTVNVASNNSVTGSLTIPASLAGGTPFTGSMEGTAIVSGNTVEFEQDADTFVRDMTWTIVGQTLVTSTVVSGLTLDVTLTRQ